jgi:hypothetical protein
MEIPAANLANKYIAAQGPLPHTCAQFWQVVWDQKLSLIVMLTTLTERGRVSGLISNAAMCGVTPFCEEHESQDREGSPGPAPCDLCISCWEPPTGHPQQQESQPSCCPLSLDPLYNNPETIPLDLPHQPHNPCIDCWSRRSNVYQVNSV